MQDLAQFQINRAPRRPDLTDSQKLLLSGTLIQQLQEFFTAGDTLDSRRVQDALATFQAKNGNPLELPTPRAAAVAGLPPVNIMAALLVELEGWLASQHDRPAAADLLTELQDLRKRYQGGFNDGVQQFFRLLADWLAFWSARSIVPPIGPGTRLELVAALAMLDDKTIGKLSEDDIWALLNLRVVMFPAALVGCFPAARVKLVRDATVADLQVVRSEWRGYVPGEIANMRNVMAGETFELIDKQLSESETTITTDTQKTTKSTLDVQQIDQSDISRQVNTQLQASVQGYLNTQYQQSGPGNSFSVSAGISGGVQIGRSESTATRIAKQSVSRAVSEVESQTRQIRSQRTLIRTEETIDHKFEGATSNRRGVYRWLDRIDRYQVFTFPNRLQLEFELPSPAEYYRSRIANLTQQAQVDVPPPWNLKPSEIDVSKDPLELAIRYRASNLPSLPDQYMSVVSSISLKPDHMEDKKSEEQWLAPEIVQDLEMLIPDGYEATQIQYSGYATPLRAVWHREYSSAQHNRDGEGLESFHTIVATVAIGTHSDVYANYGNGSNTIQGPIGVKDVPQVQYQDAMLSIANAAQPGTVQLPQPATAKIKVGVEVVGASSMTLTFAVICQRTKQTEDAWRFAVYDALYSAWNEWNRAYRSDQQSKAFTGTLNTGESSPERNQAIVHEELKRQVVEWLLQESPFQGRDGLQHLNGDPWREIDFTKTLASAPVIQFLEQAFEWNNLTWIFYPYFWADRTDWNTLNAMSASDPAFEQFLKAGSARVILPTRPGMEQAVQNWLDYQVPFLGRPMPVPGDPLYVSIATEIRDLTSPADDGIPGDSWETQVGTTFVWLDDSGAPLPANPLAELGAPPHEPKIQLFPPPAPPQANA